MEHLSLHQLHLTVSRHNCGSCHQIQPWVQEGQDSVCAGWAEVGLLPEEATSLEKGERAKKRK